MGKGGLRYGAGRPISLEKQLDRAEKLAHRLREATKLGLDTLAADYPALMTQAVEYAKAGDKTMLRFLLELMSKMVAVEEDEDSAFKQIVKKWGGKEDGKEKVV